jgi:hypothetical protein
MVCGSVIAVVVPTLCKVVVCAACAKNRLGKVSARIEQW